MDQESMLTPTDHALPDLELTAPNDVFFKIATTTDGTVVIKQIMINEEIEDVTLPAAPIVEPTYYTVTLAEAEHGELSFASILSDGNTEEFEENEEVRIVAFPDEGYQVGQVTVGNEVLVPDAEGVYSFYMPAYDVTVSATFMEKGSAITNTVATVKAAKVLRDGQLIIEKNGVLYNAQGAVIE